MDQWQLSDVLTGLGIAAVIGLLLLWFDDGGRKAAWIRSWFAADDTDVLSSRASAAAPDQAVVSPGCQRATEAGHRMAITHNADNAALSDNTVAHAVLPEAAREIIRFQAKVEAVATLLASGRLTNKAEAIEQVFGCSRSSKPESVYQRANRALSVIATRSTPMVLDRAGNRLPMNYPMSGRAEEITR